MEHYYSLNRFARDTFGCKLYKLALNGGMSCPNRDGTLGDRGCIFCSQGGSGDFAASSSLSITDQIEAAKALVARKAPEGVRYIAYFQAYTNTYAPVSYLRPLFTEALEHPEVAVLSVATRPDCLPPEVLSLLEELSRRKPVWVELGLQTIHPASQAYIRSGFSTADYDRAVRALHDCGLSVITHVILGLPGESREDLLATIHHVGAMGSEGVKLQLLHVLKGTDLAEEYKKDRLSVLSLNAYIDLLIDCIEHLPPETVIHRLTGDGPKSLLLAPLWSADKHRVLRVIQQEMDRNSIRQGKYWTSEDCC